MTIIDLNNNCIKTIKSTDRLSCAIGSFDGVHLGHIELLKSTTKKDNKCNLSAVFTFDSNPHFSLNHACPGLITDNDKKNLLFKEYGIDLVIYEEFDNIKDIEPEQFIKDILLNKYNIKNVVCGEDFRFGSKAKGTALFLKETLESTGNTCSIINIKEVNGIKISSTDIREFITNGEIESANNLLGHEFSIRAQVTHGNHIGRTMGFPTINQVLPVNQVVPKFGVYASTIELDGTKYISISNIGIKPTIEEAEKTINCETNIIDFNGDLYDKFVEVKLHKFIRPEIKFNNIEELQEQISKDKATIINYFKGVN